MFGDGRQTRDWVECRDVVRANLLAADSELTGPINIGHGQETSVLELLDGAAVSQPRPPLAEPEFLPEARRGAAKLPRCVPGRAELGWEAEVELQDGLRRILVGL